ncbi:TetR/AcrR family transcriptional regulator [Cellulomonas endometrii]|uniref:TetR/AcrR family transcriptional regulator n=1 Tax=Cellulomonas endometrii TaxID=3036301 RepID=UPI0024AE8154|nr:TetR/AcrR family transcriptional regulator [Cellulomonas endometrii]
MAATTGPRRPTGRRAGDSGTRDAILDAALRLFAEHGYDGASIRAIASAAGVDPGLVRHFFGDKDALFASVLADRTTIPARVAAAMADDSSTAGRAATDTYLRMWEEPGTRPILLALVRSATTSARAAAMLREIILTRVQGEPGMDDERIGRVGLAASQLLGVAVARHVIELPPVVRLSHEELVDQVAPTIQRYLDGTHR